MKLTVSESPWPLIVSFPSLAFQKKVSGPPLPETLSAPAPPRRASPPVPPVSLSFPPPPFSVVASVVVKTPLASLTTTASFPPPALTTIDVKRPRPNSNSTVPLPPTSPWSFVAPPGFRRRTSLSLAALPVNVSTPPVIFAL